MDHWLPFTVALVLVLCSLDAAEGFPDKADCGASELVRQQVASSSLPIGETDSESFPLDLGSAETAVIVIKRLNSRRRNRIVRRRQQDVEDDLLKKTLCEVAEEEDDVVPQPLFDDDEGNDGDGCGDLEDDDAQTAEQNIGGVSHYFEVRVLDESFNEVSFKAPMDEVENVGLATRGQQGSCAHPKEFEITGVEGQGNLEVSVTYLRRDPSKWNLAAISFDDAKTIDEGNLEWCGNVNWIRISAGGCAPSVNTPKWRLWLNPKDKLLLTAELQGRDEVSDFFALEVSLVLYSDKGTTVEDTILQTSIKGLAPVNARYRHKGSTSGWYYLELVRDKRHVYEYRFAFEFKRKCRDNGKKRFVFPKDSQTCSWLQGISANKRDALCNSSKSNADVVCPKTCGRCTACPADASSATFYRRQKRCKDLPNDQEDADAICSSSEAGDICLESCGKCPTPTPI